MLDFGAVNGYFPKFFAPLTGFSGKHVGLNKGFYGFFGQIWDLQSLLLHAKQLQDYQFLRHEIIAIFTGLVDECIAK